jgi:citrate synthase
MLVSKTSLPEGYKPGLEDVVAGTSSVAEVDASLDALIYRGYAAHELAEKSSYQEVAYLLLYGKLPTKTEFQAFKDEMVKERALPDTVLKVLKSLPPKPNAMTAMSMAVAALYMTDPDGDKQTESANLAKAKRLIAKAPTIVATVHRLSQGKDPIAPKSTLGHGANFLYMMTGQEPDPEVAKIFNATQILYAEHGYNASTFSALVTASTLSDMHSAVSSAIGTLKGPLHGGANEAAIEMLLKLKDESNLEAWLTSALQRKEKIMGFGHRVYRHQDSRAPFMKILAEKMAQRVGDKKLFPVSCKLEELMRKTKNLFPNVDYHCAVSYYLMGLPVQTYTPIFAMARMAGWTAHIVEQHAANRLIRPECFYTGPRDLSYVAIDKR